MSIVGLNFSIINFKINITNFAGLVLKNLTSTDEATKLEVNKELETELVEIKNIANNYKQHLKTDKPQE